MANEIIRPKDLPDRASPVASEVTVSDNGSVVAAVTWTDGVNAAVPVPTQPEAEAGSNNTKRMTPLTTKQAIDYQVPTKISTAIGALNLGSASQANVGDFATAAQGAKADSAVQPVISIATQHSLQGGGDLSADRTMSLVGDVATPGANKVYGTNSLGNRVWKDDPAGGVALSAGQCVLQYASTTELKLFPKNGNKISVGADFLTIPSAGVVVSNSGFGASELRYIYAYNNAGSIALEASTTGHSRDSTSGVEIKTGDASRTLVGMAMTNASSQFQYDDDKRYVRSWFNRQAVFSTRQLATTTSTSSLANIELTTDLRCHFLIWHGEIPIGWVKGTAGGITARFMVGFNGSPTGSQVADATGRSMPIGVSGSAAGLSEGAHYSTFMCSAYSAGSIQIVGADTDGSSGLRNELYIPGGQP